MRCTWPRIACTSRARRRSARWGTRPGRTRTACATRSTGSGPTATCDERRRRPRRVGGGDLAVSRVRTRRLLAGWTGKLWALSQGVARCDGLPAPPGYLLLTDADIRYEPEAVAALVSSALDNRWALSSLMVALRCESLAERALIPAFVFF